MIYAQNMTNRLIQLASDACCFCIRNEDALDLRVFQGGEFGQRSTSLHIQSDAGVGTSENPASTAWSSRWLILAYPHGRAFVFEFAHGQLSLNSSFDCPLNTSAVAVLNHEGEDSALIVFGTDEGTKSSNIQTVRLTFTAESLSVKMVRNWPCPAGVSSIAILENRRILIGFTSREEVFILDPFSTPEQQPSPSLSSGKSAAIGDQMLSLASSQETSPSGLQEFISGDGCAVKVFAGFDKVFTLSGNGSLSWFGGGNKDRMEGNVLLGFDVVDMQFMPLSNAIVVCGWRGEVALLDMTSGSVARYRRQPDGSRLDSFCISVSADSRILLLMGCPDEPARLEVVDLGKLALVGVAPIYDDITSKSTVGSLHYQGTNQAIDIRSINNESTKSALADAWEAIRAADL